MGLDVGSTATKAVRLHKGEEGVTLVAAEILPAVKLPPTPQGDEPVVPLKLPPSLRAKYASMAFTAQSAVVKLLTFPGHFDAKAESKVVDNMGLDSPDSYRVAYKVISEGHARSEARALTVAWAEEEAAVAASLLPTGVPAPFSLEVSGLASMAAFQRGPAASLSEDAVGAIDFGASVTTFALFNKGTLALLRRFTLGTNALLLKVQEALGVDSNTAQGIVMDGSFDISQSVVDVMDPLIKQLIVSRDFVERRENCHVDKVFVSGGLASSRDALEEMRSSMEVDVELWNPFQGLLIGKGVKEDELKGQEWRFAAAIGACLGTFEEL